MIVVSCYATDKPKSERLCNAFAAGVRANGQLARVYAKAANLEAGAAVFYGVRPHQMPLLNQAVAEGRDWYYIDNAYFDATRERYFRITRNRMQHSGAGTTDCTRFAAIGQPIRPWRKAGAHVLVCPQSDEFMDQFCEDGSGWTAKTVAKLNMLTDREIRVRPWQANKLEWYQSLPADLRNCWALVTYSSASAISAMLEGIPAFVTAADCISALVANTMLHRIEQPSYCANLLPWCGVVADNQFTVEEIASGFAWRRLNGA